MEGWLPLQDYPGYSVSDRGRVKNDRRESILAIVRTVSGHTYVGLTVQGTQVKRSVSKLVAETFIPRSNPNFTTPIHLDGDVSNCWVENMLWRPRWFAKKFTSQFKMELPPSRPVRDIKTGEEFETLWPPVTTRGLLYMDIYLAIANRTYVFPTMDTFEWVIKSR
jgi:hypothetical protein